MKINACGATVETGRLAQLGSMAGASKASRNESLRERRTCT